MTPTRNRRQEYADTTRRALIESAQRLFAEKGFAGTSLDEVAADARVTRGAVYHHFENKQALFQSVLELVDAQTIEHVVRRSAAAATAWDAALAGLDAFLDRCLDRTYQRICFEEGPAGMGFVNWWLHGEVHVGELLRAVLQGLQDEGKIDAPDIRSLASVMYGALTASAVTIGRSDDPARDRVLMRDTLVELLAGLRP